MTGFSLGLASASLLLIGVALWLWQNAAASSQRAGASLFAERQISRLAALMEAPPGALVLERKSRFEWPRLTNLLLRAGIASNRRVLFVTVGLWCIAILAALAVGGGLAALVAFLLFGVLAYFRLWWMVQKRTQEMARQLPDFLDSMVRLVTIGNSLPSAFQELAPILDMPLRDVLMRASQLNQAGLDLDLALRQMARLYRLDELYLVAAVMGVATRFGGRVDVVLERMALFMRDIQQARQELTAMSAEIRVSAWVLALLPIGVGSFMMIFNSSLYVHMWTDPLGVRMLLGAVALQVVGSFWLYRLARGV